MTDPSPSRVAALFLKADNMSWASAKIDEALDILQDVADSLDIRGPEGSLSDEYVEAARASRDIRGISRTLSQHSKSLRKVS